jgi:Flagellar GTP-binding protein
MRLKTFDAPTISQAMQLVRVELGEDAIIVSTEPERGRRPARVVAALEDELPVLPKRTLSAGDAGTMGEPVEAVVERALNFHGIPPPLIAHMLEVAREFAAEGASLALSAAIDAVVGFQPLFEQTHPRNILLFGSPGAGKTLTAAKLLLRIRQTGWPAAAITTDVSRAGGIEQLEAFTRILDVPLTTAPTAHALSAAVSAAGKGFVIIDTAGANLFDDAELDELADLAAAASAEPVVVFAAGGDVSETTEMAEQAASIGCRRMVVTRLDIARRFGSIVTAADAVGLALAEVGVSPQVADGLSLINPVSFARLLLPEAEQAAPACVGRTQP